jgi:hypothetical protein
MRKAVFVLVGLTLGSCATTFTGSPYFPAGVPGCRAACERDGLEMSSFVYSGEFSSSCVCRPRLPAGASTRTSDSEDDAGGADAAAAVGVVLKMREAEQQQQQRQRQLQTRPAHP